MPATLDAPAPARAARFHGWTTIHDLHCAAGHHIRQDAIVLEHGAIRCKHRDPARRSEQAPECGRWLYVLGSVGWTVERDEAGNDRLVLGDDVFVADVTWTELRHIRAHRLNAGRVLDYLGVPRLSPPRRP